MPENTPAETVTKPACPDDGTCHHHCGNACFRVLTCGPLSGVYPGDTWPTSVREQHLAADEIETNGQPRADAVLEMDGAAAAVTVESVQAHLRERNNGQLPECPVCEQAPVLVKETELPSDTPTGLVTTLLGNVVHVRRAVIVVCSREEDCTGMGIEITGPPTPEPEFLCKCPDGDCKHKPNRPVVTHRVPIGFDQTTPCCDKSPLELPRGHRITADNARVTCAPTPTVVYHWSSRMLPPKPINPAQPFDPEDYLPRPDPNDAYECALRDVHGEAESRYIGWTDPVNPDTDREQWEWVPYYLISYPNGSNIKPLRVCEDCATYLTGLAPYLRSEADTAKLTDRIAFDYPTADALDALYYLAHAEDPATREPLGITTMDGHSRSVFGSSVLHDVCTPLTTSRAVLLQHLPHVDGSQYDACLFDVHKKATRLVDNAGEPEGLVTALDALNTLINSRPGA